MRALSWSHRFPFNPGSDVKLPFLNRLSGATVALLALLVGAGANLNTAPAHAAVVPAIDASSITLSNETRPGQELRLYDSAKVEARWSIPDQTGKPGDTFVLGLPEALHGRAGTFDLVPDGATTPVYGSCEVTTTQVECTLNQAVVGQSNVGGKLWVSVQANQVYAGSTVTFLVNDGTAHDVPLPNNATGITYDPWVPTDTFKMGYVDGDKLVWRIIIPGSKLVDQKKLSIADPYHVDGSELTLEQATFYSIPSTAECWNNIFSSACYTELWSMAGTSTDGVSFEVDDDIDIITGSAEGPFDASKIYSLHLVLNTGGTILPGSEFTNTAKVNDVAYSQTAVKEAAGGGTGAGSTVGHIELVKTVEGSALPQNTVFALWYSFAQDGKQYVGTMGLRADGTPAVLRNLTEGTQVTFTEISPLVNGYVFGDPAFAGTNVTDGGADSPSATVVAKAGERLRVNVTNHSADAVKVIPKDPSFAAGTCQVGAPWPDNPTITATQTEGIDYSVSWAIEGTKVHFQALATALNGYVIDQANLPAGWTWDADNLLAKFEVSIDQPSCLTSVVPAAPKVTPGVCKVDAAAPADPIVTLPTTTGITYSTPKIDIAEGKATVTVGATSNDGYYIDGSKLTPGWVYGSDGTATYSTQVDTTTCVKPRPPKTGTID